MHQRNTTSAGQRHGQRWECLCATPPVLLATLVDGTVILRSHDRTDRVEGLLGRVRATCPRCGQVHVLTLEPHRAPDPDDAAD